MISLDTMFGEWPKFLISLAIAFYTSAAAVLAGTFVAGWTLLRRRPEHWMDRNLSAISFAGAPDEGAPGANAAPFATR